MLVPDLNLNSEQRREHHSPSIKVESNEEGPNEQKAVREQLVYAEMLETREKLIKEIKN
jgi:hypothetical protein